MSSPENPVRFTAPLTPGRPVERLTRPFERFLALESASGIVLLACTVIALLLANSEWADGYRAFWATPANLGVGGLQLRYPLWYWVNDGLMALFFFVIGLEIKREVVHGELRDPRRVATPVAAAAGGVIVPVLLFLLAAGRGPERAAWAVPMATDIAFVVGALALLGPRVPHGLKIMVLTLAIVDDLLAVLVIAFFFSSHLAPAWLAGALAGLGVVYLLNRIGVRTVTAYAVVGVVIWLCTLKSGVHPTVAGVVLGLMTPASAWLGHGTLATALSRGLARLRGTAQSNVPAADDATLSEVVTETALVARESVSPLERLEHAMHPWVAFAIMPVFALANAGIAIGPDTLFRPLALSIAFALALGKPIGIVAGAWVAVRLGWGSLPESTGWRLVLGAGVLSGTGFTMSLFVASLALQQDMLETAKGGVLLGSLVALVAGMLVIATAPASPRDRSGEPRS